MNNEQKKEIKMSAENSILKGSYSNVMQTSHTKEEFVLDFMLVHPPVAQLVSRTITSPGHLKRIIDALRVNLEIYEKKFGSIEVAEEPKPPVGFDTE